jgi:hypothetical protein
MPKARPLSRQNVEGVRLGRQGWETLADLLCLKRKTSDYLRARREIRQVLKNYRLTTVADQVTPAGVIETLTPLVKHARALVQQAEVLVAVARYLPPQLSTRALLVHARNVLVPIEDALAEASRRKPTSAKHRRLNNALRIVVPQLLHIFQRFYAEATPSPRTRHKKQERTFVFETLRLAGIKCPDPEDQRSRFNKLLARPTRTRSRAKLHRPKPRSRNPKRLNSLKRRLRNVPI